MFKHLLATGAAALLVPAGLVALQAPASAQCRGGCDDMDITVRVSDRTPASGQQFIVRGRLDVGGRPGVGKPVTVQTWRAGHWEPIRGARVTTNSEGRYRVRLILQAKGERLLRVSSVIEKGFHTERQRFTVRVH